MAKKTKLLTEAEFVEENLNGRSDGWAELVRNGYAKPETLIPGELHAALTEWKRLDEKIGDMLEELEYEPG